AFVYAAEKGNMKVMSSLLDHGISIQEVGYDAVSAAAKTGRIDVVSLLLEQGAPTGPKNLYWAILFLRAIKNGNLLTAHNLIDNGFDITGQYLVEKRTPLHWAAEKGFVEITNKLLGNGVSANSQDRYENTPLHLAARKGHSAIVSLLLDRDANISAKNVIGRTPLHLASMMNHPKSVSILLYRGAEVQTKDLEGWTPIQLTQIYQHGNIAKLL
ncbi:ankyrin repeat-containing domain protein, partial [Cenococcum geophilum]